MRWYTCNVEGNVVAMAESAGYHAYYANGVTAIEVRAKSKTEAAKVAGRLAKVLHVFE